MKVLFTTLATLTLAAPAFAGGQSVIQGGINTATNTNTTTISVVSKPVLSQKSSAKALPRASQKATSSAKAGGGGYYSGGGFAGSTAGNGLSQVAVPISANLGLINAPVNVHVGNSSISNHQSVSNKAVVKD